MALAGNYPPLAHSNYFGNAGFIIETPGEITTDLYGLSTGTLVAKAPQTAGALVPPLFSQHPVWPWLYVERQRVTIKQGYLWITLEYAGIQGDTLPIYELCLGLGEEPIETHPKFSTEIAGKPSSPLNGAFFIDPQTGQRTTDDSLGVFEKFVNFYNGAQNPFAGITAYLDFSQAVWRERYYSTAQPTDIARLGKKDGPRGSPPGLDGNRFWLFQSLNFEQRGIIFGITREWKASARTSLSTTASDIIYT